MRVEEAMMVLIVGWFRIPMRGYELTNYKETSYATTFRIPMRGYERSKVVNITAISRVPNPHEGL